MRYTVMLTSKSRKAIDKLPEIAKETLVNLIDDLEERGPVQPKYKNYSKLGKGRYHCHLSYHWVACWECKEGTYVVEVYYVGSRESAPY